MSTVRSSDALLSRIFILSTTTRVNGKMSPQPNFVNFFVDCRRRPNPLNCGSASRDHMKPKHSYLAFGQILRSHRKERGLTLRRVAALSQQAALDSAGAISNSYLSAVEHGRATALSLPKLLTLAKVYGADVSNLINQAPLELRTCLTVEFSRWKAAGRPVPKAGAPIADHSDEVGQRLDVLLFGKSRSANIALHEEEHCKHIIRRVMQLSATVPFLCGEGGRCLQEFWMKGRLPVPPGAEVDPVGSGFWPGLTMQLIGWLFHRQDFGETIYSAIDWWTMDILKGTASCHFQSDQEENLFGYTDAPYPLLREIRELQVRWLLRLRKPRGVGPKLQYMNSVLHAAKGYIEFLITTDMHGEILYVPDVYEAVTAIADFGGQFPKLAVARKWAERPEHAEAVRLLKVAEQVERDLIKGRGRRVSTTRERS